MTRIVTPHTAPLSPSPTPLPLELAGRTSLLRHFTALKSRFHLLLVPGLFGSGPLHWQSEWSRAFGLDCLHQSNWNTPTPAVWDETLSNAIHAPERADKPVLLIGHSLGAILCARWLRNQPAHSLHPRVAGAFLVAPADAEQAQTPDSPRISAFAPLPNTLLPAPTTLIASQNDPWLHPARAKELATAWGSDLKTFGHIGHIGSNEPLGLWADGAHALFRFVQQRINAHATGASGSTITHS